MRHSTLSGCENTTHKFHWVSSELESVIASVGGAANQIPLNGSLQRENLHWLVWRSLEKGFSNVASHSSLCLKAYTGTCTRTTILYVHGWCYHHTNENFPSDWHLLTVSDLSSQSPKRPARFFLAFFFFFLHLITLIHKFWISVLTPSRPGGIYEVNLILVFLALPVSGIATVRKIKSKI